MPAVKIITPGNRFGRWTALEVVKSRTYPSGTTIHFRECRCECGTVQFVAVTKLRSGHSRSCGCLQGDVTAERNLIHGYAVGRAKRSRIYNVWSGILTRCTNQNVPAYEDYGARGITVCERWLKFENFLEDMGEPPPGLTIDRLDNDKGYFKDNCAWRTPLDQARNRRSNLNLTFDGLTLPVVEWAARTGIGRRTIEYRYHAGWPADEILTTPADGTGGSRKGSS